MLAAAWLFLHPDDYGLEFPRVDASPGQVQLVKAMTLSELTVCLGQAGSRDGWFRTLRNLNPRVDPNKRLPAGSSVAMPATLAVVYRSQCVDGRMAELAMLLQDARQPGGVANGGGKRYVVKRGDTLATIARTLRVNRADLADANYIKVRALRLPVSREALDHLAHLRAV